jgi:hypothetical protein
VLTRADLLRVASVLRILGQNAGDQCFELLGASVRTALLPRIIEMERSSVEHVPSAGRLAGKRDSKRRIAEHAISIQPYLRGVKRFLDLASVRGPPRFPDGSFSPVAALARSERSE